MRKLRFALFGNIFQAQKSAAAQRLLSVLLERQAEVAEQIAGLTDLEATTSMPTM